MAKAEAYRPSETELAILQVLWRRGPSTVREVHDELSSQRKVGYTTTLKLLQIMAGKGLVERDEAQRSHVYHLRPESEGDAERACLAICSSASLAAQAAIWSCRRCRRSALAGRTQRDHCSIKRRKE